MRPKKKALVFVLLFSFLWSVDIIITKFLLRKDMDVFSITFQGQAIVTILVFSYIMLFRKKSFSTIRKKTLPYLLSFGAIGSGLGIGLSYVGLSMSTSINYGFVIKTSVIFTMIVAHLMYDDEKINFQKTFLSFLFLLGIYLLSTNGKLVLPNLGDMLILAGAFMLGVSNNFTKVIVKHKVDTYQIVLFRITGAVVVSFLLALITRAALVTPEFFLFLLPKGIIIAVYLYFINKTIEHSSPTYLSMRSMLVPVIVLVMGIVFLRESLGVFQAIGGVIIIGSGFLLEYFRSKEKL